MFVKLECPVSGKKCYMSFSLSGLEVSTFYEEEAARVYALNGFRKKEYITEEVMENTVTNLVIENKVPENKLEEYIINNVGIVKEDAKELIAKIQKSVFVKCVAVIVFLVFFEEFMPSVNCLAV